MAHESCALSALVLEYGHEQRELLPAAQVPAAQ